MQVTTMLADGKTALSNKSQLRFRTGESLSFFYVVLPFEYL